jgi:hypothetical protein
MFHSRSIEAVVWGMPLLNYKGYRDGHFALGVKMKRLNEAIDMLQLTFI